MEKLKKFEDLLGKTLAKIEKIEDDELVFTLEDGEKYKLWHPQVCCKNVIIVDIIGTLDDFVGM